MHTSFLAGVGGLTIASLFLVAGPALAGNDNVLRIEQTSPTGSTVGNSATIDQSQANNSLVAGPNQSMIDAAIQGTLTVDGIAPANAQSGPPVVQRGEGNDATLTIVGDGGQLQLLQDNSTSGIGSVGNVARAAALGTDALGVVLQIGDGNNASLSVDTDSVGLISQNGSRNVGGLTVGSSASGQLVQNGDGNTMTATVASGTSVVYTQNGSNLSPVGVQGVQVFSTAPGTVSITQTGF